MKSGVGVLVPLGLLIGLQVLDVIVHVATNQIEPIRITSNVILSVGGIGAVLISGSRANLVALIAVGAYLLLNLAFLVENGAVNPSTDALRVPLFVFVILSLILTYWLSRRQRRTS